MAFARKLGFSSDFSSEMMFSELRHIGEWPPTNYLATKGNLIRSLRKLIIPRQ